MTVPETQAADLSVPPKRLRSPVDGAALVRGGDTLVAQDSGLRFPVTPGGIPVFAQSFASREALARQLQVKPA